MWSKRQFTKSGSHINLHDDGDGSEVERVKVSADRESKRSRTRFNKDAWD